MRQIDRASTPEIIASHTKQQYLGSVGQEVEQLERVNSLSYRKVPILNLA
ncbi:hypothetical protein FDUTEX481_00054 [Tolypothrix sp. PCC 7601]|nr:hypothetical protein FDUTEX481_00054 [Tolypothrix sp. PCC 7601]